MFLCALSFRRRSFSLLAVMASACGGSGASSDGGGADAGIITDARPPDARPVTLDTPECKGETLVATAGVQPMVMSALAIGAQADGFDLDGDGRKDNKLGGLAQLARSAIEDAFTRRDLVVAMEYADLAGGLFAADDCVKLAFYVGRYKLDRDHDGKQTFSSGGDCDDHDALVAPGKPEVPGNGRDDDCDGVADEGGPADTMDRDHDGLTVAQGDCDDTQPTVGGKAEICGDGRDNDCDKVADDGCGPYDDTPDDVPIEPLSIDGAKPKILFGAATISGPAGALHLDAGPSFFAATVPLTLGISLDLRISGARISADLVTLPGGVGLRNGRVGGILSAATLDEVRGLSVPQIGLNPEDSLLDLIFANALGVALALPRHESGCFAPDIDVDGDGREGFCDTSDDGIFQVDLCIDGDGTMVRDGDGGVEECSQARNAAGGLRFVDGISVALTFEAVPAHELIPIPEP